MIASHALSTDGVRSTLPGEQPASIVLPTAEAGDWYVLRTRSRQEKILAGDLKAPIVLITEGRPDGWPR